MAAMRRLPQYIGTLKHGAWQQSGLKAASMPPNFGIGMVLQRQDARHLGLRQDRPARRRLRQGVRHAASSSGAARPARERAVADGYEAAASREALFEARDVLVAAPAPERRDARHRQARRPVAHEADGADRQHLARRADRRRRAGRRRSTAAAPAWPRSTCSRAEPILQGHPLLRLENAVCTPHIGYVEQDSYELYFRAAFENVVNFVEGKPTNIVNPEALRVRH